MVVVMRSRRTVGGGTALVYGRDALRWGGEGKSVRGKAPAVRQLMSDQAIVCRYWW